MATLVKNLKGSRKVIFDTGRFDDWCVYVVEANGYRQAPHDVTYFCELLNISMYYPEGKVYSDFVSIYELTSNSIDSRVLCLIDSLASTYKAKHQAIIEQWFTVLYAGMIAEENKANAILKKRVKRLGMHQVLVLGMPPSIAAKYSIGMNWRDLDATMKRNGI